MSRKLTDKEINTILADIIPSKSIPRATFLSVQKKLHDDLRKQLVKISIYPEMITKLHTCIVQKYYESQVQPGESVGISTAQSIGERQTQMTLNTFHSAGMAIATVLSGVPRFGELLNASKEPKLVSCQIHFKDQNKKLEDLRKYIGSSIRAFTLADLVVSKKHNTTNPNESWYDSYMIMNPHIENIKFFDNSLTLILNTGLIYEYSLSLVNIAQVINSEYDDVICVPSPLDKCRLDIFINTDNILNTPAMPYITEENKVDIYLAKVVIPTLFDIVVCGIPGINNIFFKKHIENGETTWMAETQGSNFAALLANDKIKKEKLLSNNMWDIYNSLGIEAARQFLIDEFMNVVSSDGTYINERHVLLLVDIMTFSGNISSISRYGIKRAEAGPLAKASFEESLDNFLKAGVYGDVESTKGISASIMTGKRSKIGTGLCDLIYDINSLPKIDSSMIGDVHENQIFAQISSSESTNTSEYDCTSNSDDLSVSDDGSDDSSSDDDDTGGSNDSDDDIFDEESLEEDECDIEDDIIDDNGFLDEL